MPLKGSRELSQNLRKIQVTTGLVAGPAMKESAQEVLDEVRRQPHQRASTLPREVLIRHPSKWFYIRTGDLLKSGFVEQERISGPGGMAAQTIFGFSAKHAPFVEFGTSRSAAYPFLGPALRKSKRFISATVANAIRKALRV